MGKICIISDIHSNIHALNIFLQHIEKKYNNIDYILNLGDFIQDGPNPCEVFDKIINDKRFINIIGNKEYELINNNFNEFVFFEEEESHELWTLKKLGVDRLNKLKQLPLYKSIELYGKKFFMIHSDYEYQDTFWDTSLTNVIIESSLKKFSIKEATLNINNHDYLLIAKNHIECLENHETFKVIQPGSLSSLNDNTIKFVLLDINEHEENINFKKLKYDSYEVVRQCIYENVPDPYNNIYTNKIKKDIYEVSITPKYDIDIVPIDWSFFPLIIKRLIKECKFAHVSCWSNEIGLINEIRSNLNIIKETDVNLSQNQILFELEVEEKLESILTNNFLNENKLKWFNVYFYLSEDIEYPYFICEHNGFEIRINDLNSNDLDFIQSFSKNDTINISLY